MQMKKYRYVVATACLLLSAAGFIGLYATSQTEDKEQEAKNQNIVEESEEIILGSNIWDTEYEEENADEEENQVAEIDSESNLETDNQEEVAQQVQNEEEAPVGNVTPEALHFNPENGLVWPIEGTVLLDYSMDSTIFFPTLQQYQYNPAMIISGKVNQKVYFVAKGKKCPLCVE